MGDSTSMNLRIDKELKKQAEELFESFGLTMTSAINMFLKQAVREKSIPFRISHNATYNFDMPDSFASKVSDNATAYYSANDIKTNLSEIFKEAIAENIIAPPQINADLMTADEIHENIQAGLKDIQDGNVFDAKEVFNDFLKEVK